MHSGTRGPAPVVPEAPGGRLAGVLPGPGADSIRGSYSTVTDFARLRGLSMSRPRAFAV